MKLEIETIWIKANCLRCGANLAENQKCVFEHPTTVYDLMESIRGAL
jgi:hypothetical protein